MSSTAKKPRKKLSYENLTPRQQEAIDFAYEHEHGILMCPMGFGKSVVALTALDELLLEKQLTRVLVLAPLRVCDLVWSKEQNHWKHLDCKIAMATGNEKERLNAFESDANVVVMNFDNLPWFFDTFGDQHGFDGLVLDELTKLKHVGGRWFKSIRHRVKDFKWRLGMTGTMADEGLDKLYGMCLLIDEGQALGRNKDVFLRKYFRPIDYQQRQWEALDGSSERIANLISPFTLDIADETDDRPELCKDYRFVDMPQHAVDMYRDMCKDLAIELKTTKTKITAANAAVKSGKLQQICSGFVYDEVKHPHLIHCAKRDAVMEEVFSDNSPVMVVYQFTWELEQLKDLFPYAGVLGAGVSKKEAEATERDWNDGRLNVLLVHPKSAGHGCNLQYGGHRIVFWGPIWSRDQTEQIIARLWRRGQRHPVLVTVIVERDSIETEVMVPRLEGKADVSQLFKEHLADVVEYV